VIEPRELASLPHIASYPGAASCLARVVADHCAALAQRAPPLAVVGCSARGMLRRSVCSRAAHPDRYTIAVLASRSGVRTGQLPSCARSAPRLRSASPRSSRALTSTRAQFGPARPRDALSTPSTDSLKLVAHTSSALRSRRAASSTTRAASFNRAAHPLRSAARAPNLAGCSPRPAPANEGVDALERALPLDPQPPVVGSRRARSSARPPRHRRGRYRAALGIPRRPRARLPRRSSGSPEPELRDARALPLSRKPARVPVTRPRTHVWRWHQRRDATRRSRRGAAVALAQPSDSPWRRSSKRGSPYLRASRCGSSLELRDAVPVCGAGLARSYVRRGLAPWASGAAAREQEPEAEREQQRGTSPPACAHQLEQLRARATDARRSR